MIHQSEGKIVINILYSNQNVEHYETETFWNQCVNKHGGTHFTQSLLPYRQKIHCSCISPTSRGKSRTIDSEHSMWIVATRTGGAGSWSDVTSYW